MPPGKRHEAIIKLSKEVPDLLANLIARAAGKAMPTHDTVQQSGEAANLLVPIERLTDGVQVFRRDGVAQLAVVFEMQHEKDRRKERDWPYFVAAMELEHDCPAVLVVVTVSSKTAKWAREPITFGFGRCSMEPIVICLNELKPGDDMGLMLLFALKDNPTRAELERLCRELNTMPPELAKQYADIVGVGLFGTDAYEIWSDLMTKMEEIRSQYQEFLREEAIAEAKARGLEEGKAEGEALMVIRALEQRGFTVSDRRRRKILACQDRSQLEHWFDQALVTDDVERLFNE